MHDRQERQEVHCAFTCDAKRSHETTARERVSGAPSRNINVRRLRGPIVLEENATEINFTVPVEGHVIPEDNSVSNVFCFAALADKNKGNLYTDATGALLVRSINEN